MAEFSLRDVTMFKRLSDETLDSVANSLEIKELKEGEVLFDMGDPGDVLVLVKEGKIAIFAPDEEAEDGGQAIRVFETGEILGEMALIDKKPRSLSARAEDGPAEVYTLSGANFQSLLSESPEMVDAVMGGLSDRVRYTTDFLGEVSKWVGKITDGDYQAGSSMIQETAYEDKTLAALAAEFAKMAAQVKEREDQLKGQIVELQIEIDEVKRKQEASDIMSSDLFKQLKAKAKKMREEDD